MISMWGTQAPRGAGADGISGRSDECTCPSHVHTVINVLIAQAFD
jgi:hypothetical protein